MKCNNDLTLAVAGSRKTQGIVDECAELPVNERVLVVTYTKANQDQIRSRLSECTGSHSGIDVSGWFAFLITHFVRPFLPFAYYGKRVCGFDFESPPQQYSRTEAYDRYFNSLDQVRRVHLPQLAVRVETASHGEAVKRLSRLYDRIYIDEVQDLCGYDLEVLSLLLESPIQVSMVGDVRQAIIVTNDRERKNQQYMYMRVLDWFRAQERSGRLAITERAETWRCGPEIAAFADGLFDAEWGFAPTVSHNERKTSHDGIFFVHTSDVGEYVKRFTPLFLRHSMATARNQPFEFMNIGISKGLTRERVLIWPTSSVRDYLSKDTRLTERQASELYVGVTRAQQSVGFVTDDPGGSQYPFWSKD